MGKGGRRNRGRDIYTYILVYDTCILHTDQKSSSTTSLTSIDEERSARKFLKGDARVLVVVSKTRYIPIPLRPPAPTPKETPSLL